MLALRVSSSSWEWRFPYSYERYYVLLSASWHHAWVSCPLWNCGGNSVHGLSHICMPKWLCFPLHVPLVKSVGSDESLSLLYMVNVSVWYFVSHPHKVMTTLILVVLVLVCWNWCDSYVECFTVEFSLQSHIYDERVWYFVWVGGLQPHSVVCVRTRMS